jgi:hypothetical protein
MAKDHTLRTPRKVDFTGDLAIFQPTIFILGSALSATTKQHGVLFAANNKVKIKTSTTL